MRIGTGYDVHRLTEGRDLIIGGVAIPYELGLLGHSDADVLLHAVSDALLGAAALGDIGTHFPDTDPAYKGISSILLLERVGALLEENMFFIENIDATIIAQAPKMRPYIDKMRENIADALHIGIDQINVKATTEEGLGFTGEGKGISAQAVCILTSPSEMATMEVSDVSILTSPSEMATMEVSDVSMLTSPREMATMETAERPAARSCEGCSGCKKSLAKHKNGG